MKASENEIFFVEDDVEPNTEGQFNDIPTKLELRTNDLCTHLINKSLLKEFMLIIWEGDMRGRVQEHISFVTYVDMGSHVEVHTMRPHAGSHSCWGGVRVEA